MAMEIFNQKPSILVTGGSGFIGKCLLKNLLQKNFSVFVFVSEFQFQYKRGGWKTGGQRSERPPDYNLPTTSSHSSLRSEWAPTEGFWRTEAKIAEGDRSSEREGAEDIKNLKYLIGDLKDYQSLKKATNDIDIVIHLAAVIEAKNPKDYQEINVEGTKNLVKACLINKVKRIIFTSSINVLKGKSLYAQSKREAEKIIINSGLNYTIFRPTIVYGKGDNKNIAQLIKWAKKYHIIPIVGSGDYKVQPIYVEDLTNLIIKVIFDPLSFKKIYPLGGKDILSFNQLAEVIKKNLDKKIKIIHLPLRFLQILAKIKLLPYRFREKLIDITLDKIANNDALIKDFNFNLISFEQGLRKILRE
jgi:NADH dehydrogenase